jgi:hypothetical protein
MADKADELAQEVQGHLLKDDQQSAYLYDQLRQALL